MGLFVHIFTLRDRLIQDYASYVQSFLHIRDAHIQSYVQEQLHKGVLWPEPLIQLNPLFASGAFIDTLVERGVLHPECARIFRVGKSAQQPLGRPLRLYQHQEEAIRVAKQNASYVLTTGTGSGKSLAYMIPLVDAILRRGSGRGIQAIVVYPMNALANSQRQELEKFLVAGYPHQQGPVTFERYTGLESRQERERILAHPPDILLTNYVMLELILTRLAERAFLASPALRFLVLDELHTYRGRQGADVALLVRRVRERMAPGELQCVGTSATLVGEGSDEEQRASVATMASQLFGTAILPQHVIGETLVRITPRRDEESAVFRQALSARVADMQRKPPQSYQQFLDDPLSSWLESTFGVTEREGRLIRAQPRSIGGPHGAAHQLSAQTGVPLERRIEVIQEGLLAGYTCEPDPVTGATPFAFRLHQLISKGDALYASLEARRYLTLQRQLFVPGDRSRVLLPLVFCRECGQEYYCVWRREDIEPGKIVYTGRLLSEQRDEEGIAGFLYYSADDPWPMDEDAFLERLPEEWLEETRTGLRVRHHHRTQLPQAVRIRPDGVQIDLDQRAIPALDMHFIRAPFRFCLHCGISYSSRQRDGFSKLASLSSKGRSTATTILSLSAMQHIKEDPQHTLPAKMLSFTDNRQDASLQAGHFNDFVEIGLLRSALYLAVKQAGSAGIRHEALTLRVFETLHLPLASYAVDPTVKYQALAETQRALRNVLGYRLYRDLKRGWRITSPNLEQCGLLVIDYLSLDEVCADEAVWQGSHAALVSASPQTRMQVARVLLDYMRREESEQTYKLTPEYRRLLEKVLRYARETVIDPLNPDRRSQRVRWWSALALLRSLASSPAAAIATLRNRAAVAESKTAEEADEIGRHLILDLVEGETVEGLDLVPGSDYEGEHSEQKARRRLLEMAREAEELKGAKDEKLQKILKLIPSLLHDGYQPIVFCRFIPTAEYVAQALREVLPADVQVTAVTGLLPPAEREQRILALGQSPRRVLVSTDCLSEGINLQMDFSAVVHYDLSWNPTRHEQREGRIDRYGQPEPTVRIVNYYGSDNPIDGIVLDVLLRKHRTIRNSLGISVPVPVDAEQVIEAVFEGLVLREHAGHGLQAQMMLPGLDDLVYGAQQKNELFAQWEAASLREKRSRTMFTQETIKVDEVAKELCAVQAAIGSGVDVESFTTTALKAYQATVARTTTGAYTFDISEVPRALRDSIGRPAREDARFMARFALPVRDGERYLNRTHPLIEGLASYVMDSALDPQSAPHDAIARRCGVVRTAQVTRRTTLLLVRFRYHIITQKSTASQELLAEECQVLAFEGAPHHAQWLTDSERIEQLLRAQPDANVNSDQARHFLQDVLSKLDLLHEHLQAVAHARGRELLAAHQHVRAAATLRGVRQRVEPQFPLDILGVYMYLPVTVNTSSKG